MLGDILGPFCPNLSKNEISWKKELCQFLSITIIYLRGKNKKKIISYFFFFSIWVFFYGHLRITGLQGKGEGISLTPHYYFHPLHRHLDISRVITAESSPLDIASTRTRTGNLWFPSACR